MKNEPSRWENVWIFPRKNCDECNELAFSVCYTYEDHVKNCASHVSVFLFFCSLCVTSIRRFARNLFYFAHFECLDLLNISNGFKANVTYLLCRKWWNPLMWAAFFFACHIQHFYRTLKHIGQSSVCWTSIFGKYSFNYAWDKQKNKLHFVWMTTKNMLLKCRSCFSCFFL